MTLRKLCIVILLSLPLTKSFTLPIAFALKIYELVVPLALWAAFAERPVNLGPGRVLVRWWLLFWLLSLFPSAYGYSLIMERELTFLEWATGRFDPLVNVIFHSGYLALDIIALAVFLIALHRRSLTVAEFARWWTWGAILAVGHAVVLNLAHWLNIPFAALLRFSEVQTFEFGNLEFVRSGPFEEGNFFGLYLVLSLVLALWGALRIRRPLFGRSVPILLTGIFLSASPAAIGFAALLLAAALLRPEMPTTLRWTSAALVSVLLALVAFTPLFEQLVLDKFSLLIYGGVTSAANISLIERLNESHHAWSVFLDHPLGVGIGNFGFFWGDHPELFPWLVAEFATSKQIPNNVYLEILSEQGLPGLLNFLVILVVLLAPLVRRRETILLMGTLAMLAYFIVFPTFRLLFIWAFWAFLSHVGQRGLAPGAEEES